MHTNANRLLIIDDDDGVRTLVRDVAEGTGFAVIDAATGDEFMAAYQAFVPTLIALDLSMPDVDGVELLRTLADRNSDTAIILMSGVENKVLAAAKRFGATAGLNMLTPVRKPVPLRDLRSALQAAWIDSAAITADELERAIASGQMVLHYQPKVRLLADGSLPIVGVEGLARWVHPERGLLAPGLFIPLAEETGLIEPLTDAVVDTAIAQMRQWTAAGLSLHMAINMSPQTLTDLNLPDQLNARLLTAGVPPEQLVLELTENAAMAEVSNTFDILTRFRLKKIGLALDDFGTGFSSLVQLYRLPFSELKIDRSLISDLGSSEEAQTIVRTIIDMSHALGLDVCAEGVEDEAALTYLRSAGCDIVQGYFTGKPMPAEAIPALFADASPGPRPPIIANRDG